MKTTNWCMDQILLEYQVQKAFLIRWYMHSNSNNIGKLLFIEVYMFILLPARFWLQFTHPGPLAFAATSFLFLLIFVGNDFVTAVTSGLRAYILLPALIGSVIHVSETLRQFFVSHTVLNEKDALLFFDKSGKSQIRVLLGAMCAAPFVFLVLLAPDLYEISQTFFLDWSGINDARRDSLIKEVIIPLIEWHKERGNILTPEQINDVFDQARKDRGWK